MRCGVHPAVNCVSKTYNDVSVIMKIQSKLKVDHVAGKEYFYSVSVHIMMVLGI